MMGVPVFVARLRLLGEPTITDEGQAEENVTYDSLAPGRTQPKIVATVRESLSNEPNSARVEIYNLAPDNVARIQGKVTRRLEWTPEERAELLAAGASAEPYERTTDSLGLGTIELSWGYTDSEDYDPESALGIGFVGQITVGPRRVPAGTETILLIEAKDGGETAGAAEVLAVSGQGTYEGKSYAPGTRVADVVADLINSIGVAADGDEIDTAIRQALLAKGLPGADAELLGPYNASGPAVPQVTQIFSALGLRWSIQRGALLLLGPSNVLPGVPPLKLSNENRNLIKPEPAPQDGGYQATTQATTQALPGRQVDISTATLDAGFRIDEAVTSFDSTTGGATSLLLEELQVIPGVV